MGFGSTSSFGTVITCSHLTIVRCRIPPSRGSKETCQTIGLSCVEQGRARPEIVPGTLCS